MNEKILVHLFINYQYKKSTHYLAGKDTLTNILANFQRREATKEWQTFTALESNPGYHYAFSQEYRIEDDTCDPRKVSWNRMFKHEQGIENGGDIASYDTLLARAMTLPIADAADYFAASNMGLETILNGGRQGIEIDCPCDFRYIAQRALEALADCGSEREAERAWKSESRSWRGTIRKEKKDGYCHKKLAAMGYSIKK